MRRRIGICRSAITIFPRRVCVNAFFELAFFELDKRFCFFCTRREGVEYQEKRCRLVEQTLTRQVGFTMVLKLIVLIGDPVSITQTVPYKHLHRLGRLTLVRLRKLPPNSSTHYQHSAQGAAIASTKEKVSQPLFAVRAESLRKPRTCALVC